MILCIKLVQYHKYLLSTTDADDDDAEVFWEHQKIHLNFLSFPKTDIV